MYLQKAKIFTKSKSLTPLYDKVVKKPVVKSMAQRVKEFQASNMKTFHASAGVQNNVPKKKINWDKKITSNGIGVGY